MPGPDIIPDGAIPLHGLLTVLGLLVYILGSHALNQRRHPSAAIAWVLSILLLPELGVPLYLLFGTRKLPKAARRPATPIAEPIADNRTRDGMQRLAAVMGMPPACGYQQLRLHADGEQARAALFELIDSSRDSLDLCTFILGRDEFGEALLERLAARVRDGVTVRLLLDGVGSLMVGRFSLRRIRALGIQVVLFSPPLRSPLRWPLRGRTNLRNHRKLLVADRQRVWSGGRNLASEYFVASVQAPAWIDLSFDACGPIAGQAARLFEFDWSFASQASPAWSDRGGNDAWRPEPEQAALAQWIPSGPDYADDTLHVALLTATYRAQRRVLAVTPYLVPDDSLLAALVLAARRGVQVDIVVPARSNHRLADIARNRAMRDLAAAGAHLWLVPSMVHAKAIVIDDSMAFVGSANLDSRSLFLNYELMVLFYTREDVLRFGEWIDSLRFSASRYQWHEQGLLRYVFEGLITWTAFQL